MFKLGWGGFSTKYATVMIVALKADYERCPYYLMKLSNSSLMCETKLSDAYGSKYSDKKVTYCPEYYLILILHVKNNINTP